MMKKTQMEASKQDEQAELNKKIQELQMENQHLHQMHELAQVRGTIA